MKLLMLCLLAGMTLSTATLSPPFPPGENEFLEIAAIRLPKSIAESYWKGAEVPHFTVDEDAVLRPQKGYALGIQQEERVFIIAPADWKFQPPGDPDSFVAEPIPGGMMYCLCRGGDGDCGITVTIENNRVHYFCDGGCDCNDFSESDPIDIKLDIQTLEGAWSTF